MFPDHLVCLENGKKLKRHLGHQYRQGWGLPTDYPVVAPDYATHRSVLAQKHRFRTQAGRGTVGPRRKSK